LAAAVAALGATTELRDPYTAGHQRRVAELTSAIAARLGWDEQARESLRTAALLHDIGKIAIPAEVLAKPGRLSAIEYALIKNHPRIGSELLAPIAFAAPIATIVAQHHERLDGSGYPEGLRGDEILPAARILAVADVVEAMVSHRPYRAALPLAGAIAELQAGSGRLYDAEACRACLALLGEGYALSAESSVDRAA
jgi:putative nucleotidyltransferase with HDIG domain